VTNRYELERHYGGNGLIARLDDALAKAGLASKRLSPIDLAPLDQFHTCGLAATVELAEMAAVRSGERVIDIGSGLGGPSRYLATKYGCRVVGIDLSPTFVEVSTFLAERSGLADKVNYRCADALALPFEDRHFELAWTQHVAMNIANRTRLYREVHRVLRPGGRFAIYDIVAGETEPMIFPVPWSRGPATSFLLTPASMRVALEQQGFRIAAWSDHSDAAVAWFDQQRKTRPATSPQPTLGLHLAMGPDFPAMAANLERNLRERRIGLTQAVVERP
jgi:sarcosine/dimethylglycine N-methyltransferase